ncbi:MAG: hypothetical protein WBC65_06060, partial [Ignavibacteria bacterium]
MKNPLQRKGFMLAAIVLMALCLSFVVSKNSKADTTWVTTFNQNFQNWADVHYGTYVLPNTSTFQYSKILMYYTIGCPSAGCDPWD